MAGFAQVQQDINTAFSGSNKPDKADFLSILNNLLSAAKDTALKSVASLAALSLLTGSDAAFALVPGAGLYRYNPLAPAILPSANVGATGGGQWELVMAAGAPYRRVIGDAALLAFDIKHNLNTLYPTVEVFDTLNTPWTISRDYTVTIVDANNITITTDGTAPWSGDSHTVVVKP